MTISRRKKIVLLFAAAGAAVALFICIAGQFLPFSPYWVSYLILATCPPSLMLMATEGCNGIFSWCSIQIVLLVILFNALLYAGLGAIFVSFEYLISRFRRGAA